MRLASSFGVRIAMAMNAGSFPSRLSVAAQVSRVQKRVAAINDYNPALPAADRTGIVPRPIRDAVYRWIARNRYQWFGKRDTCRLPTLEERERFL